MAFSRWLKMILLGSTLAGEFTLRNPETGEASDADSLPTGTLVKNGDNTAVTVTITNKATGRYKYSVAVSDAYDRGDRLQVVIAATVATVDDNFAVVDDVCEITTEDLVTEIVNGMPEGTINISSPIVDGEVTLYQNTDYTADSDRLFITNDGTVTWPDMSGGEYATIEFHATIGTLTKKWGTGSVIKPTQPDQQVAIAFTREQINEMVAAMPAALSYNVQVGTFAAALKKGLRSLNTYAVYAFDGSCNQYVLSTGGLTIVSTPFDSTNSSCPL